MLNKYIYIISQLCPQKSSCYQGKRTTNVLLRIERKSTNFLNFLSRLFLASRRSYSIIMPDNKSTSPTKSWCYPRTRMTQFFGSLKVFIPTFFRYSKRSYSIITSDNKSTMPTKSQCYPRTRTKFFGPLKGLNFSPDFFDTPKAPKDRLLVFDFLPRTFSLQEIVYHHYN